MYSLKIISVTPKNHFALFERNDGEFGWLEVLEGDVSNGDLLKEINYKDFTKCKQLYCYLGTRKIKISINGLGFEKDMKQEIQKYENRI